MQQLMPLEVLSLYPQHDYTLYGLFQSRSGTDPSRDFLFFENRKWTWGEFRAEIDKTAAMLVSRGVGKGDRIAIMAPNSHAHVLLLFASARVGAMMVPVNPEFGVPEASYIMGHAGVCAVLCSKATLEVVQEACRNVDPRPWFAMVDSEASGNPELAQLTGNVRNTTPPDDVAADDPCVIIYSSGTTGFPKGVMHSQRSFILSGEVHLGRTRLQPDGRVLCTLPMFHVNALFYSMGSAVAAGASAVIAPRFSASQFWRLVADSGTTHTTIMMALAAILARRPRNEFVREHLLRVVNGSGFTEETLAVFNNEFGVPTVIEGYGMTEIPAAFANPYDGVRKLSSMGKPGVHPDPARSWLQARVVDDRGQDVAEGACGELVVRAPNVMLGYYRDPEQTAAAFRDGWFMTGDLVRRDSEGYYFFVGRKKDVIRRRGENIAGAELDRVIAEHPGVSEVAAIAVDAEFGEDEIMAVIVPKAGATVTVDHIRSWCAERLAAHKVPRFVVFMDALPHTATHKVAKHLLKNDPKLRALVRAR